MADIVNIPESAAWSLRELVSLSKLNAHVVTKIGLIDQNHQIINDALVEVLQGASAGSEQAKIAFVLASAPTGWTRDTSFSTDNFLRVTDGSTIPAGASPTHIGGAQGGSNTISGLSSSVAGSHSHTAVHTHTMSHTHTLAAHTHTMDHTHTLSHTHTTSSEAITTGSGGGESSAKTWTGNPIGYIPAHTHDLTHTHTLNSASPSVSSHTGSTGSSSDSADTGPSAANTDSESSSPSTVSGHSHTIIHDGLWRPLYLNILMCKKD